MKKHWIPLAIVMSSTNLAAQQPAQHWQAQSVEKRAEQASSATVKSSRIDESEGNTHPQRASARVLSERQQAGSDYVWIYDAYVTLYRDTDYDGYYQGISLEFDADTYDSHARVYARLYLGVGDVFNEYYTTSNFSINGDSADDSLIVETELLEGFPSQDYEVLIEIYDAYNDELLTVYDGYDDGDLVYLPMESREYEYLPPAQVTVSTEYGGTGSMGWLGLGLFTLLLRRSRNK